MEHAAAYRRHDGCALRALCDSDPGKRAEAAERFPGVPFVADPGAVLADPEIDVVSIATYDDLHAGAVVSAIEHGKHVFVEKPMCTTPQDARRIRTVLAAHPRARLSSNLVLRRSPRMRLLRDMITAGDLGTLFHVEGAYNYGRLQKLTGGWRGRSPGYSVILGGAIHVVDLLLWLTGRQVVEVAAFGNGIATAGSEFEGHDMAAALLRFDDGMTGAVSANFACVRPHGHGLSVYGTRRTFINDEPHARLYTSRDPATAPLPITAAHPGAPSSKGDLVGSFIDSILGTPGGAGDDVVTADEAFEALAVCFAIDRARLDGGTVTVETF